MDEQTRKALWFLAGALFYAPAADVVVRLARRGLPRPRFASGSAVDPLLVVDGAAAGFVLLGRKRSPQSVPHAQAPTADPPAKSTPAKPGFCFASFLR